MKVKSESEVAQSCPTLTDLMDCSLPGSSIHGIFQARVLEWGAIAFSEIILGVVFSDQHFEYIMPLFIVLKVPAEKSADSLMRILLYDSFFSSVCLYNSLFIFKF